MVPFTPTGQRTVMVHLSESELDAVRAEARAFTEARESQCADGASIAIIHAMPVVVETTRNEGTRYTSGRPATWFRSVTSTRPPVPFHETTHHRDSAWFDGLSWFNPAWSAARSA